ncbi:hypothetical protein LSAT2_013901, partial [Lamellibrachia satsuma]
GDTAFAAIYSHCDRKYTHRRSIYCFAGDNCTRKMANVRGLLMLSLMCLLLCQMMSPTEACSPTKCRSIKCGSYKCPSTSVCYYSFCSCLVAK